jgi:hypothetical protein
VVRYATADPLVDELAKRRDRVDGNYDETQDAEDVARFRQKRPDGLAHRPYGSTTT